MQSKGVVIGLPTIKEKEIEGVHAICQFGKQHRHPFSKDRNVSKGTPIYGDQLKWLHLVDVDTTWPSSTTSADTHGSTP